MSNQEGPANPLLIEIGAKLQHLRETVLHKSPEQIEEMTGGEISASYIRRVEKGLNAITIDKLQAFLQALGMNLGLFFEYMIAESQSLDARSRHYHRVLQRALESPNQKAIEGTMGLVEKALGANHTHVG